jgi:hypothetical protein
VAGGRWQMAGRDWIRFANRYSRRYTVGVQGGRL